MFTITIYFHTFCNLLCASDTFIHENNKMFFHMECFQVQLICKRYSPLAVPLNIKSVFPISIRADMNISLVF